MQWILQEFEDTLVLASVLSHMGIDYSLHKVVPFVGELEPNPEIIDPQKVIFYGAYSLRHYAKKNNLTPGVFVLRPYLFETAWKPFLLNGDARTITMEEVCSIIKPDQQYFIRPVEDSKEIAGQVMTYDEIKLMCDNLCRLKPDEYILGSLTPSTEVMISKPKKIFREWRNWIVDDKLVTSSLYKEGRRVIYKQEVDDDVKDFILDMISRNPHYARAYVLDICRSDSGLKIIETNCLNAAGLYAADLQKLIHAIESL